MCDTVHNSFNSEDINTPREFRQLVGPALCPPLALAEAEDECLCPIDVAGILTAAGIDYECEHSMYYTIHHPPT